MRPGVYIAQIGAEDENLPVGQKSDFSLHLEAVFPGGGRGNCSM